MTKRTFAKILPVLFLAILTSQSFAADKKVAVLPLALYADPGKAYLRQGINSMLASRLSGEGLQVLGDQAVAPFLRKGEENGITSPERAGELAELLKVDYAVFGSVTSTGAGFSLDLSILDREKAKVTNVSEAVTEDQLIPKISDVVYDFRAIIAGVDIRKFERPGAEEDQGGKGLFFKRSETAYSFQPAGSTTVRTRLMSLDAADLDGDGKTEVAAVGQDKLMLYQRMERGLEQVGLMEADTGEQYLKVSLGDMDKDGKWEIYLVSFYGGRAQYTILQWEGKFKKLVDRTSGHIFVARDQSQEGRDMLLYQDSSVLRVHDGDVWIMDLGAGGKPAKKEKLPFLKEAQIYTLSLCDLDRNGMIEVVGLGKADMDGTAPVIGWDMKGQEMYRTQQPAGGTNNAVSLTLQGPENPPTRVAFNSRLVCTDVDDDGVRELLVPMNQLLIGHLDFKHYVDGYLAAFRLEGAALVEVYKTRRIKYCITDLQVQGETLFMAAERPQISNISEGSSRILWFE
jgi:hypothetical protein